MSYEIFDLNNLKRFSSTASSFMDAGLRYIHLPGLSLPENCTPGSCDALLCMDQRDGYPTRLFLSSKVQASAPPLNWHMTPTVAGRVWQAFSWKGVPSTDPVSVLIGHLKAFTP